MASSQSSWLGQEQQHALQALQFRGRPGAANSRSRADRRTDHGAELVLQGRRIEPQAQFAVSGAAVHPRLDIGRESELLWLRSDVNCREPNAVRELPVSENICRTMPAAPMPTLTALL